MTTDRPGFIAARSASTCMAVKRIGFILGASSGYGPAAKALYGSTIIYGCTAASSICVLLALGRATADGIVSRYGGGGGGSPCASSRLRRTVACGNASATCTKSRKVSKKSYDETC